MRKTIYTGKLPTSKIGNKEIFLGFLLVLWLTTLEIKSKRARNVFVFSQSFSNTQEESEKINLTWIIK